MLDIHVCFKTETTGLDVLATVMEELLVCIELLSYVHLRAESNLGLQQDEQKECLSFSGLHCGSCVFTVSAVCASSTWELLGELVPYRDGRAVGRGCASTAQAAVSSEDSSSEKRSPNEPK